MFQRRPQLLPEDLLVQEVLYPDAHPHGPVGIRRTDAPLGGTQLVLSQVAFVQGVQFLVVGEDQVGIATQPETTGGHAPRLEHVHLGDEDTRIDDHAVADYRSDMGIQHAARHELEGEGLTVHDDPVSGIVAPLVADDHGHLAGHEIREPALALIAPLRPDDDGRWHGTSPGSGPLRAEPIAGIRWPRSAFPLSRR